MVWIACVAARVTRLLAGTAGQAARATRLIPGVTRLMVWTASVAAWRPDLAAWATRLPVWVPARARRRGRGIRGLRWRCWDLGLLSWRRRWTRLPLRRMRPSSRGTG